MNPETIKSELDNFLANNYLVKQCNTSFESIRDSWTSGKCIVMPAGGLKYLTNAYLNIRYIRDTLQSNIPIQIWYIGKEEKIDSIFNDLSNRYSNIEYIDSTEYAKIFPFKKLHGWENKIYAITHCKYNEILYLDSDCFLTYKPENIFNDIVEYAEYGAVFSADCDVLGSNRLMDSNGVISRLGTFRHGKWHYDNKNPLLSMLKIEDTDYPELESGFMLINKDKCYKELFLTLFLNENSDFIYQYLYGDKDTYRIAWSYLNTPFFVIKNLIRVNNCIINSYNNQIIFQHRVQNSKFDINTMWDKYPNYLSTFKNLSVYKSYFDDLLILTQQFLSIYEDNEYNISIKKTSFDDNFKIKFIDDNNFILSRTDKDSSWGQDLILYITHKNTQIQNIKYIGPSNHNNIVINVNN